MNIAGISYNVNHSAVEIYLSGCKGPYCQGCHNVTLWDFDRGRPWKERMEEVKNLIEKPLVKAIWVLGGEPLDQDEVELKLFLLTLCDFKKPILLFTRRTVVKEWVERYVDYLKLGPFDYYSSPYTEDIFGITLGSLNQYIRPTTGKE